MIKSLRSLTTLLVALLTLSACHESDPEPTPQWPPRPKPEIADQTLLFYFSGRSLMSYFRDVNIPEIRSAIDQHILYDSRLLVYIQPSTQQSLLIEYSFDYSTQASRADTLRTYEGRSSIDKEHIVEVLSDLQTLAPSKRYAMVMGSHGGGWVPQEYPNLRANESSGDEGDIWTLEPEAHEPASWLYKSPGAEATRWFGEHDNQTTDIATWAAAFAEAPIRMEYLIFDACFMSNIEALYELRHAARYIVASPCEIMGRGISYATALPPLFANQGREYDLERFCHAFHDFYSTTTDTRQSGCIALTDCSELEAMADATSNLLKGNLREVNPSLLQVYEGLMRPLFYDFRQYIEALSDDPAALAAFEEQFDRTFPEQYRLHTPEFYSGYNGGMNPITYYSGISTSQPSNKFPNAWQACKWAKRINEQ